MTREWSNLAKVVLKRTYARKNFPGAEGPLGEQLETWEQTVDRVIWGNTKDFDVSDTEKERLRYYLLNRKGGPAGRGWWFSGSDAQMRLGGAGLSNCWFLTLDDWNNYVVGQDLLMLGGGVGISVEHKFVSKLPKIKRNVTITHKATKDAEFIVPDSREGWNELTRRILEAFFVTGRSFEYSTVCIRGPGEPIKTFGGVSAGPAPLVAFADKIAALLKSREGKHLRPIDAADLFCAVGEMVVSGNVRRSAIIVLGDCWDKDYLKCKRWDLANLPTQRAFANWSVVCDDIEDLHPSFWKSYEFGEPLGLINRKNMQTYGRMGEERPDAAIGVNPCAEATLESGESCNLQNIALPNLDSKEEFLELARLLHRWGKRVAMTYPHWAQCKEVIQRNHRIGTSLTGCLESPLFTKEILDEVYRAIQEENVSYSKELGIPPSIRTTTINPAGTISKVWDVKGEGIHPGFSRYMIQRIRFAANDPLIPVLKEAGHYMEPVQRFDGTMDHTTLVVDFYEEMPAELPVADEGYDTWKQLEAVKMGQKHWADQSISVTVYYKKDEISKIKEWLAANYSELKTISFLAHSDHGFKQAPKEAITKEQYLKLSAKVKPIELDQLDAFDGEVDGVECRTGVCKAK